jgi:hypothetical protein
MLTAQQIGMLNRLYNPKFLATVNDGGQANLAVVTSFEYYREMVIFGNLLLWKTARNLAQNPRAAVLVMDPDLHYYTLEGRFTGFEESGELIDHLNRGEMVRYNAYTGFRSAGALEITAASPVQKLSPVKMLAAYLKIKMTGKEAPRFPRAVAEKFAMLKSLKVIAYDDAGRFTLIPLPAAGCSGDCLTVPVKLPPGALYAASVITPDAVSFQLQGTAGQQGLRVERVYAAGLPVPGKQIYPPEVAAAETAGR